MTESLSTDNVEVAMIIAAADLTKHTGMNNADLVVKNYEMIYSAIREAAQAPGNRPREDYE